MEKSIEGFLIKKGENVVEVYNTELVLYITVYTRTGTVAVHKQMPIDILLIILKLIFDNL